MRKIIYTSLSIFIVAANMFVPACGSKSNNNAAPPYINPNCLNCTTCTNGVCVTTPPGIAGVPILPAPAVASNLDQYGSFLALNFLTGASGNSIVGQQGYTGPVNMIGDLVIQSPPGSCPQPGHYTVQGQGSFLPGYGGADAGVSGALQLSGPGGSYTAQLDPSLIHNILTPGVASYQFSMQLEIQACPVPVAPGYRVLSTPY
jgi:hypothetical protein